MRCFVMSFKGDWKYLIQLFNMTNAPSKEKARPPMDVGSAHGHPSTWWAIRNPEIYGERGRPCVYIYIYIYVYVIYVINVLYVFLCYIC